MLVFAASTSSGWSIDHLVGRARAGPAPAGRDPVARGPRSPLVLIPGFTVEPASFRLVALAALVGDSGPRRRSSCGGRADRRRPSAGASWRGCGARSWTRCSTPRPRPATRPPRRPPSRATRSPATARCSAPRSWRPCRPGASSRPPSSMRSSPTGASASPSRSCSSRGALNGRRLDGRVEAGRARRAEGAAIDLSFADALRRLPALRAHGTGRFERQRVGAAFRAHHRPVEARERRAALADAAASVGLLLTPVAALGLAGWLAPAATSPRAGGRRRGRGGRRGPERPRLTQWQRLVDGIRPVLARGRPQRRGPARPGAARPRGRAARGRRARGERRLGLRPGERRADLRGRPQRRVPGPCGARRRRRCGLARVRAAVGGLLEPSTGRLTYRGRRPRGAPTPTERARRIAFAGGDTILIPGTLRDNLLYGCPGDEAGRRRPARRGGRGRRARPAASTRAGLAGTLDPAREPKLAAAIVESRRAVQAALAADGLDRFVDPFDAERYNHHATIGENLLFGKPIGDTFREDNLAAHPFVRAILEAEDLTKPLAAMGLSIARSMIEIFADIPDGHPLFERFSFFAAADRPYFEDLVERRDRAPARRRIGPRPGAADRARAALQREPPPPRADRRRPAGAPPRGPGRFRPDAAGEPEAGDRVLRRGPPVHRRERAGQPPVRPHRVRPGRRRERRARR